MKWLCDITKQLLRHVMCQKFLTIKISTVRRNYAELTGINNDEIIFTLLLIFKHRYNRKKPSK